MPVHGECAATTVPDPASGFPKDCQLRDESTQIGDEHDRTCYGDD
jgi:hypothetical protein